MINHGAARRPSVLDQLESAKTGQRALTIVRSQKPMSILRVGEYARISDDQEDDETGEASGIGTRGAGVRRQLRAIQSIRSSRDWERHDEDYADNDLSAFKDGVVRPGFERLLVDLDAGVIDGIVCYDLDRLVRRPDDLERLIGIYDRARAQGRQVLFASAQGSIDLGSEDGIAMARIMVAFANKASRDTARRVKLKHAENRDFKRPVGGHRAFGWQWVRTAAGVRLPDLIEEAEAGLIRRTAGQIISADGASWAKIAEDWNTAGFKSPQGRAWVKQTVKQVMTSPRLAGYLVHKGQIAAHSQTGQLIRGVHPQLLSDDSYEALLRVAGPDLTGVTVGQDGVRRYLLAGLVVCGECGAKMNANRRDDRGSARHYYVCSKTSRTRPNGQPACGRVSISGVGLDALITELVLPLLEEATSKTTLSADTPHTNRLIEISDLRADLTHKFANHELGSDIVFPELTRLEQEAAVLRADQNQWLRAQGTARRNAGLNKLTTAEKRKLISFVVRCIEIGPATRRTGSTFDHTRVAPVWRAAGDARDSGSPST
jgi:site-specific DNA recombinase